MTPSTVTSLTRLAPGEALRCLADTVVAPVAQLSEGQCHRVAQAGWVVLEAGEGGAQVLSHRTRTAWQGLWQRARLECQIRLQRPWALRIQLSKK